MEYNQPQTELEPYAVIAKKKGSGKLDVVPEPEPPAPPPPSPPPARLASPPFPPSPPTTLPSISSLTAKFEAGKPQVSSSSETAAVIQINGLLEGQREILKKLIGTESIINELLARQKLKEETTEQEEQHRKVFRRKISLILGGGALVLGMSAYATWPSLKSQMVRSMTDFISNEDLDGKKVLFVSPEELKSISAGRERLDDIRRVTEELFNTRLQLERLENQPESLRKQEAQRSLTENINRLYSELLSKNTDSGQPDLTSAEESAQKRD